jgi:hypothetical protein
MSLFSNRTDLAEIANIHWLDVMTCICLLYIAHNSAIIIGNIATLGQSSSLVLNVPGKLIDE